MSSATSQAPVAFDDLTPENAATAKMPSGMGYDARCKWIAKRDYLIGRDGPITPAASTPRPAETVAAIQQTARELLAMPEGIPEPPAYFDGMQRVQWAIDHGYTGQAESAAQPMADRAEYEADMRDAHAQLAAARQAGDVIAIADWEQYIINMPAPATEALETPATPAPAAPYQTTYKAGRDVLAEANTILHADKAAGIWTDEHARADQLAAQLAEAQAWISEYRNRADRETNKAERARLYEKANESSLCASEHESELAEAMANIAAGDTSHRGPWIEDSTELLHTTPQWIDGPAYGTPPARHDHNYYGHTPYDPAWESAEPYDDTDELIAAGMLEIEPDDYHPEDDPTVMASYHMQMAAQTEYEAELYAQEYSAGVDEAHGYKGVPMPTLPAVEIATTAADLRAALAALKNAAYRRDRAYAVKAQTESERADLESRLITQVCEETNLTTGKPVFSNDTARKAEVKARLSTYPIARDAAEADATHLAAKTEYDMAEQEVKTYRALLAHETQILAMQTEIMAGQRQAQDADDLPF